MYFLYPKYPVPPNTPNAKTPPSSFWDLDVSFDLPFALAFVTFVVLSLFPSFSSSSTRIKIVSFLFDVLAVTYACPAFIADTSPFEFTFTTSSSLDFQVTLLSVALSGNTLAFSFILSPTLSTSSFSCIFILSTSLYLKLS